VSISANIPAFAMRDALITSIEAQMAPGGQLATLKYVGKSPQFQTGLVPACSVWAGGWAPPEPFARRTLKVTLPFEITIAASSAGATNRVANLDDALVALQPLVDDGNGNGIIPLLNNPATFGLGSDGVSTNASESWLGKGVFIPDIREGAGQTCWVYFVVEYHAVTYVNY
jgi:hypothetical protein